jgi:hypothetical protein
MAHEELSLWRRDAKCFGMDPNIFVPSNPGGSLRKAKAVCNGEDGMPPCRIRNECNDFANTHQLVGVFGGVMHSQRTTAKVVLVEIQDARPRRSGQG